MKKTAIFFSLFLLSVQAYSWNYEELVGKYKITDENSSIKTMTIAKKAFTLVRNTSKGEVQCQETETMVYMDILMGQIECGDGQSFAFFISFGDVDNLDSFTAEVSLVDAQKFESGELDTIEEKPVTMHFEKV